MAAKGTETYKKVKASLKRRHRSELLFQAYGISAVAVGVTFLTFFFISIVTQGYSAFAQTYINLDVNFNREIIDPDGTQDPEVIASASYRKIVKESFEAMFPEVSGRTDKRDLNRMISSGAQFQLRDLALENPSVIGRTLSVWVLADDEIDMLIKGKIDRDTDQGGRRVNDNQIAWADKLAAEGRIERQFNAGLLYSRRLARS